MNNRAGVWKVMTDFTVWVAGLGYFIDMFDITLFGVVRLASLQALGLTDPNELMSAGVRIYNAQAIGLMVGGLLWGYLADRRGRLSVMFGSILLYSLGNLANAFVTSVDQYVVIRFITGIGLAGELGAAITLVAERLPKELRGIGTTLVATLGLLGAVTASFVGQYLQWNHAYLLGGGLGIALLLTRFRMSESGMFSQMPEHGARRGDLRLLLAPKRFFRYVRTILVGVPIYFVTGVLLTFAPEITQSLNVQGTVVAGSALLWGTIGLTVGDFFSGVLSQLLRSRRRAVGICILGAAIVTTVYLTLPGLTANMVLVLCFLAGFFVGYWAVMVTMAAEQFGTNVRGTVATTVPNFVRGAAAGVLTIFAGFKSGMGTPQAALLTAALFFGLAALALWFSEETFSKDLDYFES